MKSLLLLITVFSMSIFSQTVLDSLGNASYSKIVFKNNSYFILSSSGLTQLEKKESFPYFRFTDNISGDFNSAVIAVNKDNMLLKNNDTIYIYGFDSVKAFVLLGEFKDSLNIDLAEPFGDDFLVNSSGVLKLVNISGGTFTIKDKAVAVNFTKIIYPYLLKDKLIYKYLPGFGLYVIYSLQSFKNMTCTPAFYSDKIIFRTWLLGNPPTDWCIKVITLAEPNFPLFQSTYWQAYLGGVCIMRASEKYIVIDGGSKAYDWSSEGAAYGTSGTANFYPFENRLFEIKSSSIQWLMWPETHFKTLVFERPDELLQTLPEVQGSIIKYSLEQNYPNPFNSSTLIKYYLPERAEVFLNIYDILGREAAVLVNDVKNPGWHYAEFNAAGLSAGVYVCLIRSGSFSDNKKLILLK